MVFIQQQKQPYIKISICLEAGIENAVYSGADLPIDCFVLLLVDSGQKAATSTSWMTTVAEAFFNDTD